MRLTHLFPATLLLVITLTAAADDLPPTGSLPDFTASYSLKKAGLRLASVRIQFSQNGSRYHYTSLSRTEGLISLFREDRIMEQSRGEIINGRIRPHEYRYQRTGKKRKNLQIDFDWQQQRARHSENGHETLIAIPTGAVDEFVTQIALMLDLAAGPVIDDNTRFTYPVVDDAKLKQRSFALLQREPVETGAGRYDTVKVIRARTKGSRITHFWLAPALHYLPARIEHVESDGGTLTLELNKVEGLTPGDAAGH